MKYCDGGWEVFQRRFNGREEFQRNWSDYKRGFGNKSQEFWLGLDTLHRMTYRRGCKLRIDMWDFDEDHAFAEYSAFSIEDENDMYRLHVGGYSGTAGDGMTYHEARPFSTPDRDNDAHASQCTTNVYGLSGGWWFNACYNSKLNS
uniref:Fibrinogen C-terminal domain-containing protein n=1 Tax=Ciona savignyi TaxID=51511 RepID=H2ZBU2_CIOSA